MLHVQSVSAWAPACIGPYAQAAAGGGLLHLAGQIGLYPASMQLVPGGARAQACCPLLDGAQRLPDPQDQQT